MLEVVDSIVMDDAVMDVEGKFVRSMVGMGTKILSAHGLRPKGQRRGFMSMKRVKVNMVLAASCVLRRSDS